MAEAYGINLVADAYEHPERSLAVIPSGEEWVLRELLNRAVLPHARWGREGTFLHIRRHTWFQDRLAEVPEHLVRPWSAYLRQRRHVSLEDAARLALTLRDEQIEPFAKRMRAAGVELILPFGWEGEAEGTGQRAILRSYGSLLPAQRRLLQSGGWMAVRAMPMASRRWLERAVACDGAFTAASLLSLGPAAIAPSDDDEATSVPPGTWHSSWSQEVQFRLHSPDSVPVQITVRLPEVRLSP
jgi:hypothetical protein